MARNAILFLLLGFLLFAPAAAGEEADIKTIEVKLHDLELLNQDGQKVRFKSDIIADRIAVVVPFYTTCTTGYPILIYVLTCLQDILGDRLGREVVLVSITVDYHTDIPIRLQAFARRHKAKPGWVFLTGDRDALTKTVLGLGIIPSVNIEDHNHTPLTTIGSVQQGWKRFYGFPSPELLLGHINTLLVSGQKP